MYSRRDVLRAAGVAGIAALARPITDVFAKAAQPATPVNFTVPAGACDTHTCILGNPRQFPFAASRSYTPETASVAEMRSVHRALHLQRVVIVQPSVYGADNSCTLDAITQLGAGARGVAVLGDSTSNEELDRLHRGGIRGFVSTERAGQTGAAAMRQRFTDAVDRIKDRPWHVDFHGRLSDIDAIKDLLIASPVPVLLFDHFGGARPELGLGQPGFDTLLSVVHGGHAYVDLSAVYRISKQGPDYPDAAPIARALIAANPQRVTWGTGWPHPERAPGLGMSDVAPLGQIDDGHNLNLLASWTSSAAQLKLILSENPARIYGF